MDQLRESVFSDREVEIPVPELEGWGYFPAGDPLVWKVRNLSFAELWRARETPERDENVEAVVETLSRGNKRTEDDFKRLAGLLDPEVPDEVRRRISILTMGSVSPVIGDENRLKIVEMQRALPGTFFKLTTAIDQLTGRGAVLGKPSPSGKTPESETP